MSNKKPTAPINELLKDSPLDRKCNTYLNQLRYLIRSAQEDGIFLSIPSQFVGASEGDTIVGTDDVLPTFITEVMTMTSVMKVRSVLKDPGIKTKIELHATILVALASPDIDDNRFALQYNGENRQLLGFSGNPYNHKEKADDAQQSEAVVAEDVPVGPAAAADTEGQPDGTEAKE